MKAHICGEPVERVYIDTGTEEGKQRKAELIARYFPSCNPDNVTEMEVLDGERKTVIKF